MRVGADPQLGSSDRGGLGDRTRRRMAWDATAEAVRGTATSIWNARFGPKR